MNAHRPTLIAAWLGIGAAGAFFTWAALGLQSGGPPAVDVALPTYGWALLIGLAASGIVVALGALLGQVAWLARASYASCLLYAEFLAALGGSWWPWLLLASAALMLVALRRRDLSRSGVELLLLHAMGTLGALYACFQLPTFLAAWPAFREVASSLWLVLTSIAS
jgi:hypothetical protein